MTASEREDEDPQRRSYRDPIKARLTLVDELKPNQWATMIQVVARAAQRGDWPAERTAETLAMLGLTDKLAKDAREVLRRNKRLKAIRAANPTPTLTKPKLKPVPALPLLPGRRDPLGKFLPAEVCKKGLHRLTPDNRVTRKDRKTTQCRACTVARGKLKG